MGLKAAKHPVFMQILLIIYFFNGGTVPREAFFFCMHDVCVCVVAHIEEKNTNCSSCTLQGWALSSVFLAGS